MGFGRFVHVSPARPIAIQAAVHATAVETIREAGRCSVASLHFDKLVNLSGVDRKEMICVTDFMSFSLVPREGLSATSLTFVANAVFSQMLLSSEGC
jgi:hypothetical protein